MFAYCGGSYAACMESNGSVTKRLTLAQPSISGRSVATTCGNFTLRCLKAIAHSYAESAVWYPYCLGAGQLPMPDSDEASWR